MEQWTVLDDNYAAGEDRDRVGRKPIDVPGYAFRVLVTSCAEAPEAIWGDYKRRADMGRVSACGRFAWLS